MEQQSDSSALWTIADRGCKSMQHVGSEICYIFFLKGHVRPIADYATADVRRFFRLIIDTLWGQDSYDAIR